MVDCSCRHRCLCTYTKGNSYSAIERLTQTTLGGSTKKCHWFTEWQSHDERAQRQAGKHVKCACPSFSLERCGDAHSDHVGFLLFPFFPRPPLTRVCRLQHGWCTHNLGLKLGLCWPVLTRVERGGMPFVNLRRHPSDYAFGRQ